MCHYRVQVACVESTYSMCSFFCFSVPGVEVV